MLGLLVAVCLLLCLSLGIGIAVLSGRLDEEIGRLDRRVTELAARTPAAAAAKPERSAAPTLATLAQRRTAEPDRTSDPDRTVPPPRMPKPIGPSPRSEPNRPTPPPSAEPTAASVPLPSPANDKRSDPATTERTDAGSDAELRIAKAMTWLGAITLVIGFGFVYAYARQHGWVTDRGRIVGGTLSGLAMFAAAVWGRSRSYRWASDCLAAAASGVLMLTAYTAGRWEMIEPVTAFRALVVAALPLWGYAWAYRSRLAASLAAVAVLLPPAILPSVCGPSADASPAAFASYLLVMNGVAAAIALTRGWRLPSLLTIVGTGIHLTAWFQWAFAGQTGFALAWLTAFAVALLTLSLAAAVRTRTPHPLDSPMLLAAACFLVAAVTGVTISGGADAWYESAAVATTALAGVFAAVYAVVRQRLADPLRTTFRAVLVLLAVCCVPLWLTPAWTLLAWTVGGLVWASIDLRERSHAAGLAAAGLLAAVQVAVVALTVHQAIDGTRLMPPPLLGGEVAGSLVEVPMSLVRLVRMPPETSLAAVVNVRSFGFAMLGAALVWLGRAVKRQIDNEDGRDGAWLLLTLGVANLVAAPTIEGVWGITLRQWGGETLLGWLALMASLLTIALWRTRQPLVAWDRQPIPIAIGWSLACGAVLLGTLQVAMAFLGLGPLLDVSPLSWPSLLLIGSAATMIAGAWGLRAEDASDPPATRIGWIMLAAIASGEVFDTAARLGMTGETLSAILTIGLAVLGLGCLVIGFARESVGVRRFGLATLLLATAKVYLLDIWMVGTGARIVAILLLGVALLGVAVAYRRFRDQFAGLFADDARQGVLD